MGITMKKLIIILLIASTAFPSGLDNLEFGGYLENKTSLMLSEDELFSDIATLRLEGSWNFGERGGIETHMLFSSAFQPLDPSVTFKEGSVMEQMMMDLLAEPMTIIDSMGLLDTSLLDPAMFEELESYFRYLPYSSFYPKDKFILDRALLKLYFKSFDLFIGRQMIAWGTGYAFNPTDIWNAKSPLDPNAPKLGVNAIRVEIPFGSISGLTLVASPGADFEHSSAGFRLKGNLGGFDLSLCGMRVMTVDMEFLGLPRKIMAGADLAGQIGNVCVWAEGAVINPVYDGMEYTDFDSLYAQVDAGLDYNFANGLYIMLEYYYNGLGQYKSENYGYRDFMNMFGGEMSGFAQNYILGGLRKDFLDHFVFALFALGNLNDQSAMLLPELEYNFHDNISLKFSGQIGVGDEKKTEYGGVYSSILLNVTGFF
jgi:hypothetical protein